MNIIHIKCIIFITNTSKMKRKLPQIKQIMQISYNDNWPNNYIYKDVANNLTCFYTSVVPTQFTNIYKYIADEKNKIIINLQTKSDDQNMIFDYNTYNTTIINTQLYRSICSFLKKKTNYFCYFYYTNNNTLHDILITVTANIEILPKYLKDFVIIDDLSDDNIIQYKHFTPTFKIDSSFETTLTKLSIHDICACTTFEELTQTIYLRSIKQ